MWSNVLENFGPSTKDSKIKVEDVNKITEERAIESDSK